MPNYCLNGGQCVNKAQDEEDALDTTTMPICICPPTRTGARCEIFRAPPTSTTTTTTTTVIRSTTTPVGPIAMANANMTNRTPAFVIMEASKSQSKNATLMARLSKDEGRDSWASGALEQPSPERVIHLPFMGRLIFERQSGLSLSHRFPSY